MNYLDHALELTRYRSWAPTALDARGLALPNRQDWLVCPVAQTRDSDALARSNFACAKERLPTAELHRFGHWGPGWVEILLVDPSDSAALAALGQLVCGLADYPVVDDEHFGQLQQAEWEEYVDNLQSRIGLSGRAVFLLTGIEPDYSLYSRDSVAAAVWAARRAS